MPTYRCLVVRGSDPDRLHRAAIARAVTRAHHEVTGAPGYFAQVVFEPVEPGQVFIGGQPLDHPHLFLHGFIRDGRSAVDRKGLLRRLVADLAEAAELDPSMIWVYLTEHPALHMAEFGVPLPEAGEEAAWAAGLPASLAGFMADHERERE